MNRAARSSAEGPCCATASKKETSRALSMTSSDDRLQDMSRLHPNNHLHTSLHNATGKIHTDHAHHQRMSTRDIEARGYANAAGVNGLAGLAGQQHVSDHNEQGKDLRCCTMVGLWWRTKALAVIDRHVDVNTLIALDRDIHVYRKLMFPGRVHQLQLMVLVFLFVLSCGMSLSDYWVFAASGGIIDPERQLMGMLRNSVAVPVLLMLLVACRAEVWFALYGEFLTLVVIFIAGGFIIYSVFMVYLGDPVSFVFGF